MRKQEFCFGLASLGVIAVAQPAMAGITTINDVQVNSTATGIELILETSSPDSPQAFKTEYGETLVIDLINTQLQLPNQDSFTQTNPIAGVASLKVVQRYQNSVRVTLVGTEEVPTAKVTTTANGLAVTITGDAVTAETPPTGEEPPATEVPSSVTEQEPIELVVTATRTEEESQDVPRSVTVIDRAQIEEQTNLSRGLQDILGKLIPGFGTSPQRNFLTGQNLRGRRPLVLIDGVPQTANFDAPQQEFRTIDPAAIERIEVVRGPTAIYGADAVGGVVNIITRQPEADQFQITTELGISEALTGGEEDTGNLQQTTLSLNEEQVDVTLTLAREYTGNFFDAEGDLIPFTEGQDNSETIDILGKVGFDFNEEERLQLSVNYFREEREPDFISDFAIQDIEGTQKARPQEIGDPEFINYSLEPQENTIVNLDYRNEDLWGSNVNAQAFYRNYNDGQGFPQPFLPFFPNFISSATATTEQWGGRLNIESPLGNTSDLLWGFDYVNEDSSQVDNIFDSEQFNASNGKVFALTEVGTNTPPYNYESFGVFAQAQWEISEQWLVSGGVRHERAGFTVDDYTGPFLQLLADIDFLATANIEGGERDFNDTTFNVGVVYQASDEINLFANFAQGFSVVDIGRALRLPPQDLTSVEEDFPTLEPQKVDNYELGVRGNWEQVQLSLAGFFNESDLGSTIIVNDAGLLEISRAPERVYGIEGTIDWQPSEKWQLGGTFTWQEGGSDPDDDGEFDPLTSSRISPLKVTAYVENQTTPGWRNRLQITALGERDRASKDGVDPVAIDGFVTFDYISSIKLGAGTLEIGIENVFNDQYFPVFSQITAGEGNETENFAARGRMLRLGYRLTW